MIKNLSWGFVVLLFTLTSCGDDETPENTEYKDGVIVVNQGVFNTGTGTLTFKENGNSTPVQKIYSLANDGAFLGNIAQSMIEFGDRNYISINNGGKVVITQEDEFTLTDTISNIDQGRYFARTSDKLYLSSWGSTGSNGGVYEINTESNSIEQFIDLGNGPEGMATVDDLLYVANSGGFVRDSVIQIIDTKDNTVIKSIVVGDNPELIVTGNDDNLYVICNGYTDFSNMENNTPGALVKIKDQEIVWSLELPNGSNKLAIDTDNNFIYFNANGEVLKQNLSANVLDTKTIKSISAYALGFDENEKQLYIADPKDYASQGEVYVISTNDVEIDSFTTGIIPGFFHFK